MCDALASRGRQANLGLRLSNRPSAVASPHRPPSSSHCANGASPSKKPPSICAIHRHRRKTAEERFNMLARGWLAYPVTPTHAHIPPKSGCINVIPSVCLPRDALRHTQRAEPPFPGSPALRLNQLLFFLQHNFLCLAVDNNHIDTLVKANLAHAAECQLSGYGVDCKRLVALNADYAVGCNNLSCLCINLCYC